MAVSRVFVCGIFAVQAAMANQNLALTVNNAKDQQLVIKELKEKTTITPVLTPKTPGAGEKTPMTLKSGDSELTIGSVTKISHVFQDATYLLNREIPDQNEYFKHTIDISLDAKFGEKKFGHTAVELYTDLRHKGVWGKQAVFADKYEAGSVGVANVKLSDSVFGSHSHGTGKPLVYVKEGWLQMSLNAIFGVESENVHTLKLGWFGFELGRGIALGSVYGANKEILGLYSYSDDKSAPGILLSGSFIKDVAGYDIYYAKFEERSKGLSDTLNSDKKHWIGRRSSPWRGINKDDELIAARLRFKSPEKFKNFGKLEVEPYFFINYASDQKIEIAPDATTKLGASGIALEYSKNGFEFGGEAAFNFGEETVHAIDRNTTKIVRNESTDGKTNSLIEIYTKVKDNTSIAYATKANNNIVFQSGVENLSGNLPNPNPATPPGTTAPGSNTLNSASDRFRPRFVNHFEGWMGVIDAAYTFQNVGFKIAAAYGYTTGDANPHNEEVDKDFKGFVGLHEWYSGKRVKSVILLDERNLKRPISLPSGETQAAVDLSFSDLQHCGLGLEWKPKLKDKTLVINPNALFFWKTHGAKKFDAEYLDTTTGKYGRTTDEDASKFMGTEINIISKYSPFKDLSIFANFAVFTPGKFFEDVKGIRLDGDYFETNIPEDARADADDESKFRLSTSTAVHLNIGFEYRF